jgi:hypothetical protein
MFDDLYSEPRPAAHQDITGGALRPVQTAKGIGSIGVPIARPRPLGPEVSWSFFHPGRVDARYAPASFRSQVKAIDPNLDVVWHAIHERWTVWVRNARIRHRMCPGWQLLFPVKYSSGAYMPLDERTLAEIVNRSPRKWGNGRQYFERVIDELTRDRRRKTQAGQDFVGAIARDRFDSFQIKNIGHGSKFANHHSGN